MRTVDITKAVGSVTNVKARVMKSLVMETFTRVNTKKEKSVGKVFTSGPMEITTMVSGLTGKNMVTACGKIRLVITI